VIWSLREEINFAEYTRSLLKYLFSSYGVSFNIKLDVDNISMSIDKAVPCGLIVNKSDEQNSNKGEEKRITGLNNQLT
jgi:hypothetical protein